jgi:predicted transcriptional regulator
MARIKQQVIQIIQSLPDNVTLDDIMAELYFKLQVDAGLKELDEGNGIPHEEVENGWQDGLQNKTVTKSHFQF